VPSRTKAFNIKVMRCLSIRITSRTSGDFLLIVDGLAFIPTLVWIGQPFAFYNLAFMINKKT
jgi:hypothetical protein